MILAVSYRAELLEEEMRKQETRVSLTWGELMLELSIVLLPAVGYKDNYVS